MVGESSRRLYMLNRLKRFGLPEEDLVSVFVSYDRPVVEYATPVWHDCLTEEQSKKRACRIILGAKYNSYTEALDLTGLQTLSNRWIQLCTKFVVDCTRSDRYTEWFLLKNKTYGMTLRRSKTYQTLRSRNPAVWKKPITLPLWFSLQSWVDLMLCSAANYTFSAVTTYMDGRGEGEWGALVSWLFCDFLLCLWCMWVV